MANEVYKDRVMETTTTTGTGTVTLGGAVGGYNAFSDVGDGNTCFYCIYTVDAIGNPAIPASFEIGTGTYTLSGTTLSRTTILRSTNSNAAVSFGAGTKRVALVQPASVLPPAYLSQKSVLGRNTPSSGFVEAVTIQQMLDWLFPGAAAGGALITRGSSAWATFAADTNYKTLQTLGAGNLPQWWSTVDPATNGFRLSLETGVPYSLSNQTGKTTIYFTPYISDAISLYDTTNTAWQIYRSAEVSLSLGTLTSGRNYDIFAYWNGSAVVLELLAWTNNTTRATAIVRQDGVWCKTGALSRRLVGVLQTTSTTTTEISNSKCFLVNINNQREFGMSAVDTTNTWIYTLDVWRQVRANASNQFEYISALGDEMIDAEAWGGAFNDTVGVGCPLGIGIGIDSTSTNSAKCFGTGTNGQNQAAFGLAKYRGTPGIGSHVISWLERSGLTTGTTTWLGDNGNVYYQTGLTGKVWM